MYKYDIPFPNKEQYTLLFRHDAKSSIPINVAKSVSYLKTKTSLDKGTQRKTTENELPSLTQCTA